MKVCFSGELAGARTRDPNIKSVVLYLLSYEFIVPIGENPVFGGANVCNIFRYTKIKSFFLISLTPETYRRNRERTFSVRRYTERWDTR